MSMMSTLLRPFGHSHFSLTPSQCSTQVRIQGGGGWTGGPDPSGKSQVIWVSIGVKQLDPAPLKKLADGHFPIILL